MLFLAITPLGIINAPVASAAQPVTPKVVRCPNLTNLIKKYQLPPIFDKIAYRESRCQKVVGWNYKSGSGPRNCTPGPFKEYQRTCRKHIRSFDSGYWQVNSTWYTVTKQLCNGRTPQDGALFDDTCQGRVVRYLYDNGGLNHWKATSGS